MKTFERDKLIDMDDRWKKAGMFYTRDVQRVSLLASLSFFDVLMWSCIYPEKNKKK